MREQKASRNMSETDTILNSEASHATDDFWLQQGKELLAGSFAAVSDAARGLLNGLGLLTSVYLGILGFAEYIPMDMPLAIKSLFVLPLLIWLISLYNVLQVLLTQRIDIVLFSPDDIRQKTEVLLVQKQKNIRWAFWMLTAGLLCAFVLFLFISQKFK